LIVLKNRLLYMKVKLKISLWFIKV
jgi:hypothetical protein